MGGTVREFAATRCLGGENRGNDAISKGSQPLKGREIRKYHLKYNPLDGQGRILARNGFHRNLSNFLSPSAHGLVGKSRILPEKNKENGCDPSGRIELTFGKTKAHNGDRKEQTNQAEDN